MTTRPLVPADHAFVSALTAAEVAITLSADEEALYMGCAADVLDRITRGVPVIDRLELAFVALRAALKSGTDVGHARFDLRLALHDFHRWRLGQAQAAMGATRA